MTAREADFFANNVFRIVMKLVFASLWICSFACADSSISPDEFLKSRMIPGVTTERSTLAGTWIEPRTNTTITLAPTGAASVEGGNRSLSGSWTMQENGMVVLKLKDSTSKECSLYCYVLNNELIEDQICYRNVFVKRQ